MNACRLSTARKCANASAQLVTSRRLHPEVELPSRRTGRIASGTSFGSLRNAVHAARCCHRTPLRAPHQDQPVPLAASPLVGRGQKPDLAWPLSSCACASYGARLVELTSDWHRYVCSSSPSRARCCYHARGSKALEPAPARHPEEEVTPLSARPSRETSGFVTSDGLTTPDGFHQQERMTRIPKDPRDRS